jgi:hypothetical protein
MISSEYAAGFMDGEGCINVSSCRSSLFIRVLIVNTNKEVLELFKQRWGGNIQQNKRYKDNWKTSFTWRVSHISCFNFLTDIYPFLIVKKKQAEAAFVFFDSSPGKGKRWEDDSLEEATKAINIIKQLNKKGSTSYL